MSKETAIASGRRVLAVEGAALASFAETLGEAFGEAVEILAATPGRIVVCGIGKSGHVARKVAATFASTGAPAQFLHASEAAHGDLGMLTRADVALVLSNSGETAELAPVIRYCTRNRIPMIGVASRAESTLLKASDVALLLPRAEEACPAGLAPTTSTTLTMALGDALAVALMERRGFTPENFREFHPGGALGARLVKVSEIMHRGESLPLVAPDMSMSETLIEMTSKGFGVAGVVDQSGRLVGIITDGDLRRNMSRLLESHAGEVATRHPATIAPDALASAALGRMNDPEKPTTCLFVVDPEDETGAPLGVIHMHDALRAGVS
ncbi:KpsF/GutQ family sugar-phosphate isomerase [Pikeienuella piscinae]|uniref:KpsF/GutQ family sugar-phosphate isomerase n=1 Tax=Pikeienuella piscinae TaxID=2748098 RepID=A0A7L5BTJ0_9RHOB|nr:KpsF/GutQ family sugar-phosphate isomerase [Pikeienuella piscinae]QIE54361.1 KpsF/GutQ family sugar-phosphate isomerase [Pikeienuella piscinae]